MPPIKNAMDTRNFDPYDDERDQWTFGGWSEMGADFPPQASGRPADELGSHVGPGGRRSMGVADGGPTSRPSGPCFYLAKIQNEEAQT